MDLKVSHYQIYLVSAITLFAIPSLSESYARTLKVSIPVMLPVAHIGMVSAQESNEIKNRLNQLDFFEGWLNFLNFGNIRRALPSYSAPLCQNQVTLIEMEKSFIYLISFVFQTPVLFSTLNHPSNSLHSHLQCAQVSGVQNCLSNGQYSQQQDR